MGCVLKAGLEQAPVRQAALFTGLDHTLPCTTVNKVCMSGMKAIMLSATTLSQGLQVSKVLIQNQSHIFHIFVHIRSTVSYSLLLDTQKKDPKKLTLEPSILENSNNNSQILLAGRYCVILHMNVSDFIIKAKKSMYRYMKRIRQLMLIQQRTRAHWTKKDKL